MKAWIPRPHHHHHHPHAVRFMRWRCQIFLRSLRTAGHGGQSGMLEDHAAITAGKLRNQTEERMQNIVYKSVSPHHYEFKSGSLQVRVQPCRRACVHAPRALRVGGCARGFARTWLSLCDETDRTADARRGASGYRRECRVLSDRWISV